MATGICIWRDIGPLRYMSAGDALPLLNACAYLATIQHSRASSSSASCSCAWHSHAFPQQKTAVYENIHSSTLETSVSEQDCKSNKVGIKNTVRSCTFTRIWWLHLKVHMTRVQVCGVSFTLLPQFSKKMLPWLMDCPAHLCSCHGSVAYEPYYFWNFWVF